MWFGCKCTSTYTILLLFSCFCFCLPTKLDFILLVVVVCLCMQIPYLSFTDAFDKALEENKPVHHILLWGALDDQSC